MKANDVAQTAEFMVRNNYPLLITGAPGIGKSDIIGQVADRLGFELQVAHPVVSDPTDYKGLPAKIDDETAGFLPFAELKRLIEADSPLIYFLDDIGQAPNSVQAALMQLLLARQIDGKKISDHVRFIAATNRREDKAGVTGILEPVKSRFKSIIELTVDVDDWIRWAQTANMPMELITFIRYRPELLDGFEASRDIKNSPC
jgi:MoxR-like ATPase